MFVNMHMKSFNYNDFQNICRACMSEGELQKLQDGHMKVMNLISKVQYSRTDELPQKICDKCVKRVNDIMAFALLCKRIDQTLKKYLENLKLENLTIELSPSKPPVKTEEVTIVEEKIEFIDVNQQIDLDTNYVKLELERIKDDIIRAEAIAAEAVARAPPPEVSTRVPPLEASTRAPPPEVNTRVPTPVTSTLVPTPEVSPRPPLPEAPTRAPTPKPKPYQCAYCVRTFTKRSMKRVHEWKIHRCGLRFQCDICQQYWPHANALSKHRRTHTSRFVCTQCNRTFRSNYHLQTHMKSHQQDKGKPYECLICFKTFCLLKTYLKHNAVHRTFACDVCKRVFAAAGSLARHKRVHS